MIRVGHVGISKEKIQELMESEEFNKEFEKIVEITRCKQTIVSVDKMSPLSGIKNKLMAYKTLLMQHPEQRNNLLLIQYCTPSSKSLFGDVINSEIRELVKEIDALFPNSILFEEGPISVDKRLALFHRGEILLITSLRDGFNLLPFEFLMVKGINSGYHYRIIMSEFAGCVTAMSSIRRINPYNISETSECLYNAIKGDDSSMEEAIFRHDLQYIHFHNVEYWLKSLIEDMKRGHNKNETATYLGAIDNRLIKANRFFKQLTPEDVEKAYKKSINRVILLDSEVYLKQKQIGNDNSKNSPGNKPSFRYCHFKASSNS